MTVDKVDLFILNNFCAKLFYCKIHRFQAILQNVFLTLAPCVFLARCILLLQARVHFSNFRKLTELHECVLSCKILFLLSFQFLLIKHFCVSWKFSIKNNFDVIQCQAHLNFSTTAFIQYFSSMRIITLFSNNCNRHKYVAVCDHS